MHDPQRSSPPANGSGGRRQRDVREDLSEDDLRAHARHDEHPVLADEAEPGPDGDLALEKRRRVDADAEMGPLRRERPEVLDDRLEVPPDDPVVVLAPGVRGDVAAPRPARRARRRGPTSRTGGSSRSASARPRRARGRPSPRAVPPRARRGTGPRSGVCLAGQDARRDEAARARRVDRRAGERGRIGGFGGRRTARGARHGRPHNPPVYQCLSYDRAAMQPIRPAPLYPIVFLVVLLAVVGRLDYVVLRPFFGGILWASVVAVALWPLWVRVRARAGKRAEPRGGPLLARGRARRPPARDAARPRGREPGGGRGGEDRSAAQGAGRSLVERRPRVARRRPCAHVAPRHRGPLDRGPPVEGGRRRGDRVDVGRDGRRRGRALVPRRRPDVRRDPVPALFPPPRRRGDGRRGQRPHSRSPTPSAGGSCALWEG